MRHSPISMPTRLHVVRVDSRCRPRIEYTISCLFFPPIVDVFDIEGVDVTGHDAEERQADVDEEIGAAACYAIDADRWD